MISRVSKLLLLGGRTYSTAGWGYFNIFSGSAISRGFCVSSMPSETVQKSYAEMERSLIAILCDYQRELVYLAELNNLVRCNKTFKRNRKALMQNCELLKLETTKNSNVLGHYVIDLMKIRGILEYQTDRNESLLQRTKVTKDEKALPRRVWRQAKVSISPWLDPLNNPADAKTMSIRREQMVLPTLNDYL